MYNINLKKFLFFIINDVRVVIRCVVLFVFASLICCSTDEYDEFIEEVEGNTHIPSKSNFKINGYRHGENKEHNLLTNGGLEEWGSVWTPEMPEGWSLPHNEYVKQNRTIVYEGRYSAKMQSQKTGKTARLEQVIQVNPREKINIVFRYYVEQWKSKGARTYCYFRTREAEVSNIPADELKAFYDKDTYYIIRGGGYGLTYFPCELNVWHTFDEMIEVPPTANYFVFGINSYYGTTIYVDDCWVIDVTEKITTGIKSVTM